MWKRDAGVQAMIDWLDRDLPLKLKIEPEEWDALPSAEKFSACSPSDRQAIMEQCRDCSNDFVYAARNYFWITNKNKKDQLFSLWESQYLILQKWYDLKAMGKPQKIIVTKARQLGASTLIEAMIAWRSMFFPNTNAIVVSVDQPHSSYLFGLMQHIYDKMPWWLKPMVSRREEKYGLWFENPEIENRNRHPGLNSHVFVQWSNQYSGVGQGIPIDCCHVSEYADFLGEDLGAIVNEDLANSMADNPEVFGFMESTGRGAGSDAHLLWLACERRLDQGKWPKWYPVFLPSFFESTRVMAPPNGWNPPHQEQVIRDRVKKEWAKCDNPECGRFHKGLIGGESTIGLKCKDCNVGFLGPYLLSDAQLYWHQDKREQAEEQGSIALKKWKQEQSVTSEESWQASGYVLFNDACREWMQATIEETPLIKGKIYRESGEIHGADLDPKKNGECIAKGCKLDHRHDETPFWVWRLPEKGAEYSVGVDVAEGIGEDYSVIFVNKLGKFGAPDEQVAVWRDNHTTPKELACYCNYIGRWYNEALMCVEYNVYSTTGDDIVYVWHYPNIYVWKHKDNMRPLSHQWHWWTKVNTKHLLHQTAVDWLLSHAWIIHSKNFSSESSTYAKEEYASRSFGSAAGCFDDELMAGMIALYCSHELDCDEHGRVRVPQSAQEEQVARYRMWCEKCGAEWSAYNPDLEYRCPNQECGSIRIRGELKEKPEDTRGCLDVTTQSSGETGAIREVMENLGIVGAKVRSRDSQKDSYGML